MKVIHSEKTLPVSCEPGDVVKIWFYSRRRNYVPVAMPLVPITKARVINRLLVMELEAQDLVGPVGKLIGMVAYDL